MASRQQQAAMLVGAPHRSYQSKRLQVYDKGGRNSLSGIQATLFGGTSPLGSVIGGQLTSIGSQCIYPYRHLAGTWDTRLRELKTTADLGYKSFLRLNDMTSEREVGYAIGNSNVVISCVGSHVFYTKDHEFEEANITVPMTIAKAAKKANAQRFIYISAAGADPNSQSRRLRTKWIGEQEVKEIFPDVTILRPTLIMNHLHQTPTISGKWGV